MYLHLGQDTVICSENIVAMFDIDACTVSKKTRDFLTSAEKQGQVVNVSFELPKSFIVVKENDGLTIYISQLSPATLEKRTKSFKYISD